jgi:hypothetical protein
VDGSGRCPTCFALAVKDVRMREVVASAAIALQLKSIRSIGWSSFFTDMPENESENDSRAKAEYQNNNDSATEELEEIGEDSTDDIALNMKTTLWVWRTNDKMMVRRCPW